MIFTCIIRVQYLNEAKEFALRFPAAPREGETILVGSQHLLIETVEWRHIGQLEIPAHANKVAVPFLYCREVAS